MASATAAEVRMTVVETTYLETLVAERDRWKQHAQRLEAMIREEQAEKARRKRMLRDRRGDRGRPLSVKTRADVVQLLEHFAAHFDGRLLSDCLLAADLVAKGA